MIRQTIVAVLAGGSSRRMGTDKAKIKVDGDTLLGHVTRAAMAAGLPVWIIGRQAVDIQNAKLEDVIAFPDDVPGCGPIGGLATALRNAPETAEILLAPCDLPLIRPEDFRWLASLAHAENIAAADGIVPTWKGRPEPLFAIYRRSILPMIDRHIASGRLAMQDLVTTGAFVQVPLPPDHGTAVKDADTPDQLRDLIRGF